MAWEVYARDVNPEEPAEVSEGEEGYYTTSEARQVLGISRQRIHQLLNDGLLVGYQDQKTGRWLIDRRSALSYARSRRVTQYHPRLQALEAEVRELLHRLGAAESRIAVLEDIKRERAQFEEELNLIRSGFSELRQELLRLGALLEGNL